MIRNIYNFQGLSPVSVGLQPMEPFDPTIGTLDEVNISIRGTTAGLIYNPSYHPLYNPVSVYLVEMSHDFSSWGNPTLDFTIYVNTIESISVAGPVGNLLPWYIDMSYSIDASSIIEWPSSFTTTYPAAPPLLEISLNDFLDDGISGNDWLMYSFESTQYPLLLAESVMFMQIDYLYTPYSTGPQPLDPIHLDLNTLTLFPNITSIQQITEQDLYALVAPSIPAPAAGLLVTWGLVGVAWLRRYRRQ
jgi:hypothetical protein